VGWPVEWVETRELRLNPPAPKLGPFMTNTRGDFSEVLIRRKIISDDQLVDAENAASAMAISVQDMLVKFGYATPTEVTSAVAEHHGILFVDPSELEIPKALIELVPEAVVREYVVLPLSLEGNTLKIITADPANSDTLQKLQFILNKDVVPVIAVQEQLQEAINRYYGEPETTCVSSSWHPS
jgi:type IV pilus assembly protein PilB